jgi:hypothetical protein
MPGKSRRGHGRQSARGKKRRHIVTSAAPLPVTPVESRPDMPPPVLTVKPASPQAPAGTQYPDIMMELRRIGILAGIILAVLIILALVLP